MEFPAHWALLARLLGDEPWFADVEARTGSGEQPRNLFEKLLVCQLYGPELVNWLRWGQARGGIDRVRAVLRGRRNRIDGPNRGNPYRWRQVFDEFQVGYIIDQQTRLSIDSTAEPPGRGAANLDWLAASDSGQCVVIEVKSIFKDVFPWDDDEIHRIEPSNCLHGPFKSAAAKFLDHTHNVIAIVTHEPRPDAGDLFHVLFGPEVTTIRIDDRGRHVDARLHLDPSPRGHGSGRPGSMYAHFNPRENTRVGVVLFMQSQVNGDVRIVAFHNPWARRGCEVPGEWLDPWCQVSAVVDRGSIRFTTRGAWPSELRRPDWLAFA